MRPQDCQDSHGTEPIKLFHIFKSITMLRGSQFAEVHGSSLPGSLVSSESYCFPRLCTPTLALLLRRGRGACVPIP
jgi:hypothetical protein